MAHSFGKVLLSTQMACGFAAAIDGRVDKIVDNLGVVKPTFMGAAPRIFEKAHGRIVTMQAAEGGAKEKIFKQAFAVGLEVERAQARGQVGPAARSRSSTASSTSWSSARSATASADACASSSPARPRSTATSPSGSTPPASLILEGYGLTETSAGSFVNHPDQNKFGTVGPVFPGSEVKLGEGDEVLIKGPGVMDGYHNLPGGDRQDADRRRLAAHRRQGRPRRRRLPHHHRPHQGALQDLRRQVHRPAGDRVEVQGDLPLRQPVHGLRQRAQLLRRAGHPRPRRDGGLGRGERHERRVLHRDRAVRRRSRRWSAATSTSSTATLNRWETIKKWELLDHDLTVESGELTPSMKVKRNVVEDNHKGLIDAMYA